VAHQRGVAHAVLRTSINWIAIRDHCRRFHARLGSPQLLATTARTPRRVHPWVAASTLPHGRAQHRYLSTLVDALLTHTPAATSARPSSAGPEPIPGSSRSITTRAGGWHSAATAPPNASLPDAVVASCSIPGWYEPKADRREAVRGRWRAVGHLLALLARVELDGVYVLAPMASHDSDNPRNPALRAERLFRRWMADRLAGQVRKWRQPGYA
jgi:NTE family protein